MTTRSRWVHVLFSLAAVAATASPAQGADVLHATEHQITTSAEYETTPTLGRDAQGPLLVYTSRPVTLTGFGPGNIYYQRLSDEGIPDGEPVPVSEGSTDDQLNDVHGSRIVYTAFDSVTTSAGTIFVYDIATGTRTQLSSASSIREARVHGDYVAWIQGPLGATTVYLRNVATMDPAIVVAGPAPAATNVEIGDRFVVWDHTSGQRDIFAYDLATGRTVSVASDPVIDERYPSTSGPWVVFESRPIGQTVIGIEAVNLDTGERRTLVENGSQNLSPTIDGDLVAWESRVGGNYDIYVHRLGTRDTHQVTTDASDQRLNNVFGDLVSYVDLRNGDLDVYVSKLAFVAAPATASCALVPGIVGCYTFDGDAFDRSGNGNHGVVHGAPTFVADKAGVTGGALQLDGVDDHVALANEAAFDLNQLTVVATVRVPDYSRENWILNKGTLFGNFTINIINGESAYWPGHAAVMHVIESGNWSSIATQSPVPRNEFFHLVVALDGAEHRSYLNGVRQVRSAHTSPPLLNDSPVIIGAGGYYGLSDYFVGAIDEVRIYDRALTEAEIGTLYAATFNDPPVAAVAASPQAVVAVGTSVSLDATGSYDPEGDPLTYAWQLLVPAGSQATLSANTATPTFVADVHGTYTARVVVSDPWEQSAPVEIVVSFVNVAPVAGAGVNQAVVAGDVVALLGTGSDPNGDPLTFSWTLAAPPGSAATLGAATSPNTTFVADLPGTYVATLIVNDGTVDSAPSAVTVVATSGQSAVVNELRQAIDAFNGLDPEVFKNANLQRTVTSKLQEAIALIEAGLYTEALDKLQHDLLQKTNGCHDEGAPDRNDWLRDCESQNAVYPHLEAAIARLETML